MMVLDQINTVSYVWLNYNKLLRWQVLVDPRHSWILHFTLCIPDPKYWIADSFSVEFALRIRIVSGIWDSLSWITDSKAQDGGFHKQKFPGLEFWNPKYRTWSDIEAVPGRSQLTEPKLSPPQSHVFLLVKWPSKEVMSQIETLISMFNVRGLTDFTEWLHWAENLWVKRLKGKSEKNKIQ